jgi:hypothetical protein
MCHQWLQDATAQLQQHYHCNQFDVPPVTARCNCTATRAFLCLLDQRRHLTRNATAQTDSQLAVSYHSSICSVPHQSKWHLWWTKWNWNASVFPCQLQSINVQFCPVSCSPSILRLPLSVTVHQCSVLPCQLQSINAQVSPVSCSPSMLSFALSVAVHQCSVLPCELQSINPLFCPVSYSPSMLRFPLSVAVHQCSVLPCLLQSINAQFCPVSCSPSILRLPLSVAVHQSSGFPCQLQSINAQFCPVSCSPSMFSSTLSVTVHQCSIHSQCYINWATDSIINLLAPEFYI